MASTKHGPRAQYPFYCSTPVQMRFNDIDMLGHLNNNSYFQIYDLGRYDYLVKLHGAGTDGSHPQPQAMIVNLNCSFLAQTRFNEHIEVFTQIVSLGDKSFTMMQQVVNVDTGEVKSECESVLVYFDWDTGAPAHIPDHWRRDISAAEHRQL
ncbi:MAG: acyl-CoA thioesterase [Muribaculaceae bacterium]|nr:acyl-CoA thioesterase [Muribaculaceae bacterium]